MKFAFLSLLLVQSALAATFTVTMSNVKFTPNSLTINAGDTVTWTNIEGTHDTVSGIEGRPDGKWNSNTRFFPIMSEGDSFSVTFNTDGIYPYYCTPHWPLGMVGTIRVLPAVSAPTVSMLSPADHDVLSAPADITVEADAFDSDGFVTQVELFMDGGSLGLFFAPPYRTVVNNLGPGNYVFSAVATDDSGATGSASVSVTVSGQQPTISNGPRSQTVNVGSDVTFAVQATGSAPLSYQWFFGANAIPGAVRSSLLLTNVSPADSGTYMVRVSNGFGSASASATLTVTNPPSGTAPVLAAEPQSQTVNAGTNVTFTASATGSPPLSWQWFFNNSPIANATNSTVEVVNVTSANSGEYYVTVANDFGSAASSVATLTVHCDFTLSTRAVPFGAQGGSGSVGVIASPVCSWTVINTNAWIAITAGDGGTGSGTVQFTVAPNSAETGRSGVLVIAGIAVTVTQRPFFLAKNDFNHDGHTDFLWQRNDGRVVLWLMDGLTRITAMTLRNGRPVPLGSRIVGTADFDLDSNADILLQRSTGPLEIWLMRGTNFLRAEPIAPAPALGRAWQAIGVGDFNHDNSTDILLRHNQGFLLVWYMKAKRFWRQRLVANGESVPIAWRVAGVADMDNDGFADILWQKANVSMVEWSKPGVAPSSTVLSNLPYLNGRVVGLNDLNQDGKVDFIWRHSDGHLSVWSLNGTNYVDSPINGSEIVPPALRFVAPDN